MGRLLWGGPFAAMRQNLSRRWPVFIIETAQALSLRAARSQRLPLLVWLLLLRPALRLLPGTGRSRTPDAFHRETAPDLVPFRPARPRRSHGLPAEYGVTPIAWCNRPPRSWPGLAGPSPLTAPR